MIAMEPAIVLFGKPCQPDVQAFGGSAIVLMCITVKAIAFFVEVATKSDR
jgi:hypothetical protein